MGKTMKAEEITPRLNHPDQFFINGNWVKPSSPSTIAVYNSTTEQPFIQIAEAQEADMRLAVDAARQAFDTGPWPKMSPSERAKYLTAIAAEFDRRSEELAEIWAVETGTVYATGVAISRGIGDTFRYYANLAETFTFKEHHKPSNGANYGLLVREPVGVTGVIIPWNAPGQLIGQKCAPALLAGCTIVLKGSPEAPCAPYVMGEICETIGLPPGVVNVLTADRAVSELLVRDPKIDKITFTGSTAAGRRIGAICAERVARCTLELGGKSPAIILDDYDPRLAAEALATRSVFLSGQVCSALTRIIVPRKRHDELVEALKDKFEAMKVGDPFDAGTHMGPLATRTHRDRVERYIGIGKSEGATIATGGSRPSHLNRGFFIEPTVFAHVDNHSTIAREEIFGPVLAVISYDSEVEAIELANDTIYGLNAAVFTNDSDKAYAVARQLRSGTAGQNGSRSDFRIAFGGVKQSGIGREGGVEGLLPFLESKTVILDGAPTAI